MDMDLFQSVNSKQKDQQDGAASPSSGDATSKASPRKQNILSSYSFLESDLLQTSSRLRERKAAKKNLQQQQQHLSSLTQDDGSISIAAGPSDEGPTITTTNTSVLLPPPPQPHARGNPTTTAYATGACGDFNIEMPVRHGSSVSSMSSHPSGSATGGGSSSGGGGGPSADATTQPNRFQSLFSSASCGDGDNDGDGCLEGAGDSCPSTFNLQ